MSFWALFCSEWCRFYAETVRYFRSCYRDGRWHDPAVQEALQIRMAHIVSGGYDRTGRRLAAEVRAAVLAANDGLCCHCRVQVATEVDHLNGPSNDRINLQGLCHGCHIAKTMATLEPMGPLDYEVRDDFLACVYADTSCRPCYDEKVWQGIYQRLLANTRQWHAHAVTEVESGYFGDGSTGTIDDIEHGYYLQLLAERED